MDCKRLLKALGLGVGFLVGLASVAAGIALLPVMPTVFSSTKMGPLQKALSLVYAEILFVFLLVLLLFIMFMKGGRYD